MSLDDVDSMVEQILGMLELVWSVLLIMRKQCEEYQAVVQDPTVDWQQDP